MSMQVGDENLGGFLVDSGVLSRRTLEEALRISRERQEPLGDGLVLGGYLSRDELRRAHAHLLGVPFVELSHDHIEEDALFLIPEPLARSRNIVAFRHSDGVVEVALLDLADLEALDFLRTEHKLRVLPRLTTAESIKRALLMYQKKLKTQFGALARGGAHAAEGLLRHALLSRASAVHLDLHTLGLLVRYRIHGILEEAMTLPKEAVDLIARLKDMAELSPTLHVPQEGAFKAELGGGSGVRVRVHSTPHHGGERLVLHLSPQSAGRKGFTLESLGLHGESLEAAYKLLNAKSGLVLVVGKKGSGTTTLLYTLLDAAHSHHLHTVTVEEEVEAVLPHVTQMRTRSEVGLTTAATLRAALKQDPDMVMVGDVREADTATLAASAAARGVLVLAGTELPELFNAGEKYVRGVIKTALVGRVCPVCHETYKLSRAEAQPFEGVANFGKVLAALKDEGVIHADTQWKELEFARAGAGCKECKGGYTSLVGLQEVGPDAPLNVLEDGLFKAAAGLTSIEEVFRLLGETE